MPFTPDYFVKPERRAYTEEARIRNENGRIAVLMLHGYMGSPLSSQPMAQYLAEQGITVHCPLLPGHGEIPDKMKGSTRKQWIAEAYEAYEFIRPQCDELFVMGHSMGTVFGAMLCNDYPDQIRGAIMLTPMYDTPDDRLNVFRPLHYVLPWFYPTMMPSKRMQKLVRERVQDYDPTMDVDDPEIQKQLPKLARIPTDSLYEMLKVADYSRSEVWPKFKHPCIIFRGEHDPAVKLTSVANLYDAIGSEDKILHSFPESGHEVMRPFDPAHEQVWPLTVQFIQTHSEIGLPNTAVAQQNDKDLQKPIAQQTAQS